MALKISTTSIEGRFSLFLVLAGSCSHSRSENTARGEGESNKHFFSPDAIDSSDFSIAKFIGSSFVTHFVVLTWF